MVQVQRINGKLVRSPSAAKTPLQQQLAQRRVNIEQARVQQQQVQSEAQRIDQVFVENNYGGSVEEFTRQYNSIKSQNPEVANSLKVNPGNIQQILNQRISELQRLKDKSNESESKFRRKAREEKSSFKKGKIKAKAEGEKAFQQGIDQGISQLRKGEFLTIGQVKKFANQLEKVTEEGVKLREFNIERAKREAKIKRQEVKKPQPKVAIQKPSKKVLQDFKKAKFNQPQQDLFLKATTGQTLNNKEKSQLNTLIQDKNKQLTNNQKRLLRDAPKDIGVGLFEVGKEIVLLPVDALRSSFNFGRGLRKRFEAGENNPLSNDVSKLATGAVKVSTFVKNNPEAAASIVAAGSTAVGKDFGDAFLKNPVKTTTKAVAYLFPGTVVKGGVKAAGLGKKGVTNVIQAKRLSSINKQVTPAITKGGLTPSQTNSINKAVGKASKVSDVKKRNEIINRQLKKVLKARGIKIQRGASPNTLAKQIAGSKDIVKAKVVEKKPGTPRPVIRVKDGKFTRITEKRAAELAKKPRKKRDPTKFVEVKGKKAKKVTKKEFNQKIKESKEKNKPIELDVKQLEQKTISDKLKRDGVVKQKGVTYIDLNAVQKINKGKELPVKAVVSNKKAQVQFQIQIQKQARLYRTRVRKIKKAKKVNAAELLKLDKGLRQLKTLIGKTKLLRLVSTAALLKNINKVIASAKDLSKLPATDQPSKAKIPAKEKAKAVGKKKAAAQKVSPKLVGRQKGVQVKRVPKRIAKPKIVKKPRILKGFNFDSSRLNNKILVVEGQYRERKDLRKPANKRTNPVITKTIKLRDTKNRILNSLAKLADNKLVRSIQVEVIDITDKKKKDVKQSKVLNKFNKKKSKNTPVLRLVEKTKNIADTRGEKRELKQSKRIKKKK